MKKFFTTIFYVISLLFLFNPNVIYAQELDIYSKNVILYNSDDNIILFEKDADVKISIASLTKIMTCIVAIENINYLNDTVSLDYNVFKGLAEANAAVAGFKIGDKVTYRDLLMGALLPSGADATRALALNISGSEENFVNLMNEKAKSLNLSNTNFENTTGLESTNHYSTVRDVSIILEYALKNEIFKEMYTTREYTTSNGLKFSSTLKKISSNYTIDVSNILGSKTGYTDEAGLCMSSIANYNGVNYLLVTAGADYRGNTPRQLLDAINIYKYFDSNYSYKNIINTNDSITDIDVKYSSIKNYKITSPETRTKFLNNSFDINNISYEYNGIDEISYKNKIGEKLGYVSIIYDNNVIDTIDIFLNDTIKFSLFAFLLQTKLIYPLIILFIILIFIILKRKTK